MFSENTKGRDQLFARESANLTGEVNFFTFEPEKFNPDQLPNKIQQEQEDFDVQNQELVVLQDENQNSRWIIDPKVRASGNLGKVFIAWDMKSKEFKAFKTIKFTAESGEESKPEVDAVRLDRLKREARFLASTIHPNIISVEDLVEINGQPAVVMPWLGKNTITLLPLIQNREVRTGLHQDAEQSHKESLDFKLTPQIMKAIVEDLCNAIIHLCRKRKSPHFDLKPENLVLVMEKLANGQYEPHLVVLDLGVSPGVLNHDSFIKPVGTPFYMTPERIMNLKEIFGDPMLKNGEVSEVFSTASIIYELLSGKPLFPGETGTEVIGRIISKPFDRNSPYHDDLKSNLSSVGIDPEPFFDVLESALQSKPAKRMQSLSELRDSVLTILDTASAPNGVIAPDSYVSLEEQDWLSVQAQEETALARVSGRPQMDQYLPGAELQRATFKPLQNARLALAGMRQRFKRNRSAQGEQPTE